MATRASLPRDIKIGDTFPLAEPIDERHYLAAKIRKGQFVAAANSDSKSQLAAQARKIVAGMDAREARLADPFEQAKDYLRRRGYPVFAGHIARKAKGTIVVGTKVMTLAEMLDLAERQGWKRPAGFSIKDKVVEWANDDEPLTPASLLRRIEAYLKRTLWSEREFTDACEVNGALLSQLRRGVLPRKRATIARVTGYLDEVGA